MTIYPSPYFDNADGVMIMIMDDPSEDSREVYYRIPGYAYTFAFALPHSETMFNTIQTAICNASDYAEVLFK